MAIYTHYSIALCALSRPMAFIQRASIFFFYFDQTCQVTWPQKTRQENIWCSFCEFISIFHLHPQPHHTYYVVFNKDNDYEKVINMYYNNSFKLLSTMRRYQRMHWKLRTTINSSVVKIATLILSICTFLSEVLSGELVTVWGPVMLYVATASWSHCFPLVCIRRRRILEYYTVCGWVKAGQSTLGIDEVALKLKKKKVAKRYYYNLRKFIHVAGGCIVC
jgi:hypothetical protein